MGPSLGMETNHRPTTKHCNALERGGKTGLVPKRAWEVLLTLILLVVIFCRGEYYLDGC